MKFFDSRGDIEKTAHKLPHWQQGKMVLFVTFRLATPPICCRVNSSTTDVAPG